MLEIWLIRTIVEQSTSVWSLVVGKLLVRNFFHYLAQSILSKLQLRQYFVKNLSLDLSVSIFQQQENYEMTTKQIWIIKSS